MRNHLKRISVIAALVLFGAAAPAGTITYNWTFTGNDSITGSGTLTVDTTDTSSSDGFTGYLITDATGTIDGQTITGVLAPYSNDNNNLLGDGSTIDNEISGNAPLFDNFGNGNVNGVSLTTAADSTYGFTFYSDPFSAPGEYAVSGNENNGTQIVGANGPFTLTDAPEPGTLALAAFGTGAWLKFRRRK